MTVANELQAEPTAPMAVIDMEKLLLGDAKTAENLLEAARTSGFFLVDLRGPNCENMLPDIEALFALSHGYLNQPQSAKDPHFRAGVDRGYDNGFLGWPGTRIHTDLRTVSGTKPARATSLSRYGRTFTMAQSSTKQTNVPP
jgi:hypothetical protein